MPVGGKLRLKGGETIGKKKKKKKPKPISDAGSAAAEGTEAGEEAGKIPTQVKTGQAYEAEFASEIERAKEGKAKSTPWGSGFAKAPEILHGYNRKVTGDTVEERLDLRCARKTDKFCK